MRNIVLTACAFVLAGAICDVKAETNAQLEYGFYNEHGKTEWESKYNAITVDGMFDISTSSDLSCKLNIVVEGTSSEQTLTPSLECTDSTKAKVIDKKFSFKNTTKYESGRYNIAGCFEYQPTNLASCLYGALKVKENNFLTLTVGEKTTGEGEDEKKEYTFDGGIENCSDCKFSGDEPDNNGNGEETKR